MASERRPPIPSSATDSTPVSAARRAQIEDVRAFTPLRRRELTDNSSAAPSSSTKNQELPISDLIVQALATADAEINAICGGDENESDNIVSRLGLLADKVTKGRLERVHAVQTLRDTTDDLRARVATAREAAKPSLSPEERSNRLGELYEERQSLVADIVAASENTKKLEAQRKELLDSVTALKNKYESVKQEDDERLSFYSWVNDLLRKVTCMHISSSPDSGRINGFIHKEDDIINIDFDLQSVSQFDAVNEVWRHISRGLLDS